MKFILPLFIAMLLANHGRAGDETEANWLKWRVHLELTAFSLPTKIARPLLPALRDEKQIEEGWKQLQRLVEEGSAKVELDASRETVGNDAVEFLSGEELRYPDGIEGINLIKQHPAKGGEVAPSEAAGVSYLPSHLVTRTVGFQCKADPHVSDDGERVIINMVFERSWVRQWDEFEAGRLRNNEKILFKQPRFFIVRADGSYGFGSGRRVLISSHPVNGQPDQMEIVILRVSTTPRRDPNAK